MWFISTRFAAIPLYLILLVLLVKNYRKKTLVILFAIIALITASDQISVAFKNGIQRYRPCHNQNIQEKVHLVNDHCGGKFGFYSSHASNTMALTVFMLLVLPAAGWKKFLLLWPFGVGYSRVYLAAHYPSDVLAGWIAGSLLALAAAWLVRKYILVNNPVSAK
jgi:undecaprenyl-diphosphatase